MNFSGSSRFQYRTSLLPALFEDELVRYSPLIVFALFGCFASSSAWSQITGRGWPLYERKCQACHGKYGEGLVAPGFQALGVREKSDVELVQRIKVGKAGCPPFGGEMRDQELLDVVAFFKSLPGKR